MKTKKPKPTKADLRRKIRELEAQLASTYHFAGANLNKAEYPQFAGSGVILQLHALGGRELIPATCIRDGLSSETIAGLRKDIRRSYDEAIELEPRK